MIGTLGMEASVRNLQEWLEGNGSRRRKGLLRDQVEKGRTAEKLGAGTS